MKIIYDNIIFSLQKAGGASVYWSELIKRLAKLQNKVFFETANKNVQRQSIHCLTQPESFLPTILLRYFPFTKRLEDKAIFHSSHYRVSLQKNIVNITTVHDFTYEYYRDGIAQKVHSWHKNFAIRHSDGIICISENTKRDLLKFLPDIDSSKIRVIYNGVGDEFYPLENPTTFLVDDFLPLKDKKYILYVGDRSAYKNFDIAVQILKKLQDYTLVLVGGQEFTEDELAFTKDIKHKIYHFKGIESHKLNILYNNAFCLVYPSSYEGFGIPIIEAMRAGCPVISTNASSIPEIAENAALLVTEITCDQLISEIQKLENTSIKNTLIQKGIEQSKKFSWDKCFDETFSFYETTWKNKFSTAG